MVTSAGPLCTSISRNAEEKLAGIIEGFPSQKRREWFTDETFRALLRLRGIESRALLLAEAFHCSKLVLP